MHRAPYTIHRIYRAPLTVHSIPCTRWLPEFADLWKLTWFGFVWEYRFYGTNAFDCWGLVTNLMGSILDSGRASSRPPFP